MDINAAYRANIPISFYIRFNDDVQNYKHPDLIRSLMCISASVVPNKKVKKDMLLPETLGKTAMKIFLDI